MSKILKIEPLQRPWQGTDPFLFCAHHLDAYPEANDQQGVREDRLGGRALGDDFSAQDGFSMYYGTNVPGFHAHPHRGFETVTIVLQGLVDHADSLGATARYGDGDVQWLTAGEGVLHSEMFPLRYTDRDNPLDLFQIWLNLPAADKMVPAAFKMLWGPQIPIYQPSTQPLAQVRVIAGTYQPQETDQPALTPPAPAPDSWASKPQSDLAIWLIELAAGATITLPPAQNAASKRTLYVHKGSSLLVDSEQTNGHHRIEVEAQAPIRLENNGNDDVRILLLQGVPIGEPVVAMGPFVMNTQAEIDQTRRDFGRTHFGGWPWKDTGPTHPMGQGRFAKYPGATEIDQPSE